MKEGKLPQDNIADLQSAIDNLSKFAEENESTVVPHFYHLNVRNGQIIAERDTPRSSTVELARCFVTALISNQVRKGFSQKKEAVQSELIKAVETVKANYLILDRLKKGSAAERKLADAAVSTIQRFNLVIANANKTPDTLVSRFARFLYQQTGLSADPDLAHHTIDLPLSTYIRVHAPRPEMVSHAFKPVAISDMLVTSQNKVSALVSPLVPGFQPTGRERDAFRLKAMTLIRQHSDGEEISWGEVIKAVRRAPIQSTSNAPPGDDPSAYHGIVTFRQTLQPFPGELIVLEGSFQRNAYNAVTSVPITSSFKLTAKSAQTGFPHPSQHNGWALSDKLISPHLSHDLLLRKRKLANQLLPQGRLNRKAKEWLLLKKNAFQVNLDRFLALHQQLAETILSQAKRKASSDALAEFFAFIRVQEDPYDMLSLTYQVLNENFLTVPYDKARGLDAAEISSVFLKEVKRAQRQAERLKHPGMLPGSLQKYAALLGPVIGEMGASLAQQHLMEAPTPLPELAQRFQVVLHRQLIEFLEELEEDTPPNFAERLERSLEWDIDCIEMGKG